jgi:hypothetical protein
MCEPKRSDALYPLLTHQATSVIQVSTDTKICAFSFACSIIFIHHSFFSCRCVLQRYRCVDGYCFAPWGRNNLQLCSRPPTQLTMPLCTQVFNDIVGRCLELVDAARPNVQQAWWSLAARLRRVDGLVFPDCRGRLVDAAIQVSVGLLRCGSIQQKLKGVAMPCSFSR